MQENVKRVISLTILVITTTLVSCQDFTTIPTPFVALAASKTKTPIQIATPTPTPTQAPSLTPPPNQTQTAIEQLATSTQSVFQTEVAKFPRLCPNDIPYFSDRTESFSPDGLWLGELCLSSEYHDWVLAFSNRKTGVVWKMFYHDYIPVEDAYGGMRVAHWSKDSRYAYFHTDLGGDGGECFYEGYDTGVGLFRLDLQTGQTTEILPLSNNSNNLVWYGFSYSPTDKWLVYGVGFVNLVILDVTTGESINVAHKESFSEGGGYIWSPDGLQFVYSTLKYFPNNVDRESYTLRLVDAQTGSEQILLEAKTNCYLARKWNENNILQIEYDDENYNRAIMEYDVNSNTVISASASPSP